MAQAYAQRLQKGASPLIYKSFERAVAAEARRSKEKLFIEYMDKMGLFEQSLPCDDMQLFEEHSKASKELFKRFDELMMHVFDQEEVQEERMGLIERIETYFADIKDANINQSTEQSKEVFLSIFEKLKNKGMSYGEDSKPKISELEQNWAGGLHQYQDSAQGPSAAAVFFEEISFLVPFMCSLIRELQGRFDNSLEEVQRDNKNLMRQRDEARANETRLKHLLEETSKNYDKQLEQRDRQIAELQANINSRIHQAESRARELNREIQGVKLELEQSQKEKELILEAEKDIHEKRLGEVENKLNKVQAENHKYEKLLDDMREEQEKLIIEKNETINELSRRLKLLESQSDVSPRQDSNMLRSLKGYLEDILNKFSKEQATNQKYLAQLERVSTLQSELNQLRIREQENKNKLIDEYEEKVHKLKAEKDNLNRQFVEQLEKQKENTLMTYESVEADLEGLKKMNLEKEEQIRRLMEEKNELASELVRKEQQLSDQYEVLEAQKKEVEKVRCDLDDKIMNLHRLKIEQAELTDDNDNLLKILRGALEVMTKKKGSLTAIVSRVQNQANQQEVQDMLTKYKIPY
jgi:chromosome segregation ATPase